MLPNISGSLSAISAAPGRDRTACRVTRSRYDKWDGGSGHLVVVAGGGGAIDRGKDGVRTAIAAQTDGGQGAESFMSSRLQYWRHGLHLVHNRLPSVFGFKQQAHGASQQ